MAFLELLIVETVASGTILAGFRKADERIKVRADLLNWNVEEPTPVVDGVLEKLTGLPESFKERQLSQRIVQVTRDFVGRKAFRYLVEGAVNHNSRLREKFPFLCKLGKQAS